ncbi:MAG: 7-carboxy-7-deazaguanine synthase QueE [Bacteroidia bacterium]|nr:7-carboxy-7-deazaguanine synthase QueE [Bacteroidia bacterium]
MARTTSSNTLPYGQADPLPVMEQFYTLQGEGAWAGTAAYFIRLAGCDVGCHWCDVKDSWTATAEQYQPVSALAAAAQASGTRRVVITGGEPSIYNLEPLCDALHAAGLVVHLETAGPHPYTGSIDWICFSPKKFLPPQDEYYQRAHELKVIIYHEHDLKWAETHAARCAPSVRLFLQPEWDRRTEMYPKVIDYIRTHPHWQLSIQTHKYLDIP